MHDVVVVVGEAGPDPVQLPGRDPDRDPDPDMARDAPGEPDRDPASAAASAVSARTFRPIEDELRELERTRMIEALAATGGIQNRAAELIHMPLRTFVTKLRRYAITSADWRGR